MIIVACLICAVSVFFLSKRIAENARMREQSVIEANEIANTNNKDTNANKINFSQNTEVPARYVSMISNQLIKYV